MKLKLSTDHCFQEVQENNYCGNQLEEFPAQASRAPTTSPVFTSAAQEIPSSKRSRSSIADEAYSVVKEVGSNFKNKDEFDIFGDLVACELRKCRDKKYVALAKRRISDVLFDVEMHEFNIQPQSNSNDSSSLSLKLEDSSAYPC